MSDPWFKDGLKFKCTHCGKCCTGSNGFVFLSPRDLLFLSREMKMSVQEFIDSYTRIVDGQICLLDAPNSDRCIFLKDNQCSVYSARPIQCRAFPWWLHTLKSPESWAAAAQECEGINHPDAPLVDSTHIACECMAYVDNLVEENEEFDYNPKT
jgi:uncharacterized protein